MVAYVIATRGRAEECYIRWEHCDPFFFRHDAMFEEARVSGQVMTIEDLADFLDGTALLAYLDEPRILALLHINRNIDPVCSFPAIYWEYCGCYFMIEFDPSKDDITYGHLPPNHPEVSEWEIPDLPMWEYTSIKSML